MMRSENRTLALKKLSMTNPKIKWLKPFLNENFIHSPRFKPWAMNEISHKKSLQNWRLFYDI
ncbi:MAG: hypothetical protein CVU08_11730 [Bacteroidetes bacterium HGW-Bacteroidetes-3]|jgi:hypothetical protein|nr:MAG: hypothetical protein CVU08_11730 [Bacteroidetes bacterium HGW-Bacteroidetes-3]